MATSFPIAIRSSSGLEVSTGPPCYKDETEFEKVSSKACRSMLFSADGKYFVYVDGTCLKIFDTATWKLKGKIENTKASHLAFSPKSTYLMTWEQFFVTKSQPEARPNLNIYKAETGELLTGFVHKKHINWQPQWSYDERICSRMLNNDIVFYENLDFSLIVHRVNSIKVEAYTLSPTSDPPFVLCHIRGTSGQPSLGKIFKYPNFNAQQSIASKSFFQADKVDFYWNCKGTSALLLTSTEVDKTGGSYYGKQGLHFINTTGQTAMVTLSKEGPIYDASWSPKGQEFCVVYGFVPAKTTLFNTKCEPIFEFGAGPFNSIYFNPQGNLLLIGGFGNLRGYVEIWDVSGRKKIGSCEAPDTTLLHWAPNGVNFLTATTAPRLRIGNGYKVWHYSGALLHEKLVTDQELYDVCWKNFPKDTFEEPVITLQKVEGIQSSQPLASKQVYRPPSSRNRPASGIVGAPEGTGTSKAAPADNRSKAAIKQKKKRDAKKQRTADQPPAGDGKDAGSTFVSNVKLNLTGNPDKDKKLKNIKKKLDAIDKLKEQQAQGKTLEINQLAKIQAEGDLLKELSQLQL